MGTWILDLLAEIRKILCKPIQRGEMLEVVSERRIEQGVPLSQGSSLEAHRSPRNSAGASLALPAWLRCPVTNPALVYVPSLCASVAACFLFIADLVESSRGPKNVVEQVQKKNTNRSSHGDSRGTQLLPFSMVG